MLRQCPISVATILLVHAAASAAREGGETIEDAVFIDALPFADTGATCDNADDYDEVCPYDANSPDVVYAYVADLYGTITIDLCESLYDTKVFVYDFPAGHGYGNPLACNDDVAGCGYSGYQSRLEGVPVIWGHTYYIVIDGYGASCGDYVLRVEADPPAPPCVECPEEALAEGEPPLVEGYMDLYNGGCDDSPTDAIQILCGDESGYVAVCGESGFYTRDGEVQRDSDWYAVYPTDSTLHFALMADIVTYFAFVLFDPDLRCEGPTTPYLQTLAPACETLGITFQDPGEEVWLMVTPDPAASSPPMTYAYLMQLYGIGGSMTPTTETTWGRVKELFRDGGREASSPRSLSRPLHVMTACRLRLCGAGMLTAPTPRVDARPSVAFRPARWAIIP